MRRPSGRRFYFLSARLLSGFADSVGTNLLKRKRL
jgi:hypothetical protein